MEKSEVFEDLDNYLTQLNSFFSLNRDSSKQDIYISFKKFAKSFEVIDLQTSNKIIQYLQICYDPLGEVAKISGEFAEKDLRINSKTKIEKSFTDSVLFYLTTLTLTYYKLYNETVEYLKIYTNSSTLIKGFIKIQNRMKIWLLMGFLSIPFAFLGLISILAIIITSLSIILFIYDRFVLSTREVDKLKLVGLALLDKGKTSLEEMIIVQKKMSIAAELINSKKHFISTRITSAFDKLIAGKTLSTEELIFYSEELIKSKIQFEAQFK